jgi:hypothetical protein
MLCYVILDNGTLKKINNNKIKLVQLKKKQL